MIFHLNEILVGDVLEKLRELRDESVQCVVTSPPYWGLRNYGVDGQIGLEATPQEYIEKMVAVFREVRRVLRADGTLWLNIGDSYVSGSAGPGSSEGSTLQGSTEGQDESKKAKGGAGSGPRIGHRSSFRRDRMERQDDPHRSAPGLKPKDLVGIPWRLAFALQADGWWLRSDIIWSKPNPMPESVTDRPTKAHEYVFLLTKSERYYYDAEAIKENVTGGSHARGNGGTPKADSIDPGNHHGVPKSNPQFSRAVVGLVEKRNKRTVWEIGTEAYPEAHFATYPTKLVEPCILAGTSEYGACAVCGAPFERATELVDTGRVQKMPDGMATHEGDHGTIHKEGREKGKAGNPIMAARTVGWKPSCECGPILPVSCTVLDPFFGSGTTGLVALRARRHFIGIELNPEYAEMARRRLAPELQQGRLL